jgi:hypothetical protein
MVILSVVLMLSFGSVLKPRNAMNGFTKNHSLVMRDRVIPVYDCPPVNPDDGDCGSAFTQGTSKIPAGTAWAGNEKSELIAAVNNYISKCSASKCQTGCPAATNDETWPANPQDLVLTSCEPEANPLTTGSIVLNECPTEPVDAEGTCSNAYQSVLNAVTVPENDNWNGEGVKNSIAAYVTACRKTACNQLCADVISSKNVQNEYTKLKEDFILNCNPPSSASSSSASSSSDSSSSTSSSSAGSSSAGSSSAGSSSTESSNDTDIPNDDGQNDNGFTTSNYSVGLLTVLVSLITLQLTTLF